MDEPNPGMDVVLARVRVGDEEAARDLVSRLHPLIMKIVRAHRPRRTGEEDLAQEVYVRLFERLDRYEARDGVPFEHWVSRLTVRICLDALRAERRRPEVRRADLSDREVEWLDFLLAEGAACPASEPGAGSAEAARELVDRLLAALPAEDRLVLQWLDLEERSSADVAARTGWSGVGVRVRAFRARARLRRIAKALGELP